MKFYRGLQPFKVISFDLDDTLYDNHPVIQLAEQKFLEKLNELSGSALTADSWREWKNRAYEKDPIACEDVVYWREESLRLFLHSMGKSAVEISQISEQTMATFVEWRHQIDVPQQSFDILNRLKKRYQISVITNGNVDPHKIGFSQFELILTGGKQGRAKPHKDLFHQTADFFKIKPQEILHVGDHLTTDVQGAIQAGCQAVWLNLSENGIGKFPQATTLPTVEISALENLLRLV